MRPSARGRAQLNRTPNRASRDTKSYSINGSNKIMRLRADAYNRIVEKYKNIDPEAVSLFEQESSCTSHSFRKMLTPEQLAENEEKNRKQREIEREMYENDSTMNQSVQVESYDIEAYTHIQRYMLENLPGVKSLFDIKFAGKQFEKTESRSILDILETISYDEEKQALFAEGTNFYKIDSRCRIGYHDDSLKFRGVTGHDGKQHLCPFRTVYSFFYRGQNTYYENCLASIDRNLKTEDLFAERVKATALERLFGSNPAVFPYIKGQSCPLPDGKEVKLSYHIDYPALAQHYCVKTNLLDLTTDKMIAAFFACSGYNWMEDEYHAFNKDGHGVFYVYRDANIFSEESRISCAACNHCHARERKLDMFWR